MSHHIQLLQGNINAPEFPHPSQWKLHPKQHHATPLNMSAVKDALTTTTSRTKDFFEEVRTFMRPYSFFNSFTSRTIKATSLDAEGVQKAVDMRKFELCDSAIFSGTTIPRDVHCVNMFTVPEVKGRRRLITGPHLNGAIKSCCSLKSCSEQNTRSTTDWERYQRWDAAAFQTVADANVGIDTPNYVYAHPRHHDGPSIGSGRTAFTHAVRKILARIKGIGMIWRRRLVGCQVALTTGP